LRAIFADVPRFSPGVKIDWVGIGESGSMGLVFVLVGVGVIVGEVVGVVVGVAVPPPPPLNVVVSPPPPPHPTIAKKEKKQSRDMIAMLMAVFLI
jgi:hypothetical protein